jgi:hypothetical protein
MFMTLTYGRTRFINYWHFQWYDRNKFAHNQRTYVRKQHNYLIGIFDQLMSIPELIGSKNVSKFLNDVLVGSMQFARKDRGKDCYQFLQVSNSYTCFRLG